MQGPGDCCRGDLLKFEMQHNHVLKKLKFGLLTLSPGSVAEGARGGGWWGSTGKKLLQCCDIPDSL